MAPENGFAEREIMSVGMKRVLFVVYMDTHFGELLRAARALKSTGDYAPLFFFEHRYPTIQRSLQICAEEGFECLGPQGQLLIADASPSPDSTSDASTAATEGKTWSRKISSLVRQTLGHDAERVLKSVWVSAMYRTPVGTPLWMLLSIRYMRMAQRIIRQWEVRAVVLAVGGSYSAEEWIKAARKNSAASIVVPFAMSSVEIVARVYGHRPDYQVGLLWRLLFGSLHPEWLLEYDGNHLIRTPAAVALAHETLGIAPPHPWLYNSSHADAIAIESEQMLRHYRRQGLPPDKLVVTGALSDDVLAVAMTNAAKRRAALYRQHGFSEDQPLVLVALPPNQFIVADSVLQSEYRDYDELVESWMEILGRLPDCNVLVRLHPRESVEKLRYIERWGVTISELDTAQLIPLCDLYIASFSATIRWAITCGKPVVNHDVLLQRLPFYESAQGVVTVETRAEFGAVLRRCVEDRDYWESLKAAQRESMQHWGSVDGLSATRLCALIDELCPAP